jgi:RHS repeat-associated protein
VTLVDGSYWLYGYDFLGQLNSAKHYWKDGTAVAGQQFENLFDDIGNRKTSSFGGDSSGANLRNATYGANSLNQYTNRTVPGFVNVLGAANSNATVTLWTNGHLAALTSRKGEYYRGEIPANDTAGPPWLAITNFAVLNNGTNADIVTNLSGNYFLAQTPEQFGYDQDGNLTNDGRWTIGWDGENRALSFTSLSGAPVGSKKKVDCAYDWQSRRIQKIVSAWNGSAYVAASTSQFVYDGWNLIAILNGTNGLMYSFAWGLDLSGTPQGAGGVGGLISMTDYTGAAPQTYFYVFDGNGNVAALVSATDGSIAALYEYGPFGELLRATGPMARVNPFMFSTKFHDWETGFYYYGYRYYSPSHGRWVSRDPIGEQGGESLYAFVGNAAANQVDLGGLSLPAPLPVDPAPPIQLLPPPGSPPGNVIIFPGGAAAGGSAATAGLVGAVAVGVVVDGALIYLDAKLVNEIKNLRRENQDAEEKIRQMEKRLKDILASRYIEVTPEELEKWADMLFEEILEQSGSGKWVCAAKCHVCERGNTTGEVFGFGSGPTMPAAHAAAEADAKARVPAGSYPRHCHSKCVKIQ